MALNHGVSGESLAVARQLLSPGGEIIGLHVYEQPQGSVSTYLDEGTVRAAFEQAQSDLEACLTDHPDVTPTLLKGHSGRTIVDHAAEVGADCIVIASHKPDLRDFFLGSTAARVVRHAPCAVHVTRTG